MRGSFRICLLSLRRKPAGTTTGSWAGARTSSCASKWGGGSVYQFSARATKEGYNSGYDPDSYTWDGYATWYGTKFVDHVPYEITPEEIEKAIAAYS